MVNCEKKFAPFSLQVCSRVSFLIHLAMKNCHYFNQVFGKGVRNIINNILSVYNINFFFLQYLYL